MRGLGKRTGKAELSAHNRFYVLRTVVVIGIVFFVTSLSRAGGPEYVAGTSYFVPTMTGQPLVWAQGTVTYYTDQGDLSTAFPGPAADALVADAWSRWSSISTVALSAASGGHLAEEVDGSNVVRNSDGTITLPPDIQPDATATPVGIVYDEDGSVTDALLGSGASDPSECFNNAVFGGVDNFSTSGTLQHALVVLKGQCAVQLSQTTEVEYRLVRVLGTVLGLSWSQVNPNVITGKPAVTPDDLAGFPLMHYKDPQNCVPITLCYPSPLVPAMDDSAAISRLYPVTAQNQSNFPGKQIFSTTTASIHGSVWFADASGNAAQAMQGVNVMARWVDPNSGLISRRYVGSSVSGHLFTGSAGNPITGFLDSLGDPFSEWGSADQTLEGFFDLSGLQLPDGATSGQYQLSIEGLDPLWAAGVAPYIPFQVAPSGTPQPILVNVTQGVDVAQDIIMSGSAQPVPPWAASETWDAPAVIPTGGDWQGSLSGHGDVPYFSLTAQANRTLSIAVTALDENGAPAISKLQPVVGMWSAADPQGTPPPAFTPSSFNSGIFGLTRLDAQILAPTNFLIGVADLRGDGRPDYHYHAHVLYADSVSPVRLSARGGVVTVHGIGFAPGLMTAVDTISAPVLAAAAAGQLIASAPAQTDGLYSVTISDPVSGGSSTMSSVLLFGAAPDDKITLLQGGNPSTPVGTQATNPVMVRVFAADGITPVSGATVGWSATNLVALSVCSGLSSCSVVSDETGMASTWVTPGIAGVGTITATLAPGVYSTKSVSGTLLGSSSATDLGVTPALSLVAQGASVSLPLQARVLGHGIPKPGVTVGFNVIAGTGKLSSASATTDVNGYAVVTLTLTQLAANVQVNACVEPGSAPCKAMLANSVASSLQNLQPVTGSSQAVTLGQSFQPLTVRVVDNSAPPNPVLGANVIFQSTVLRPVGNASNRGGEETVSGTPAQPVILSVSQATVPTDVNGLASIIPAVGGFDGSLEIDVQATAGTNSLLEYEMNAYPAMEDSSPPIMKPPPAGPRRPINLCQRLGSDQR